MDAVDSTAAPTVEVADTFVELMRSFHRVKTRYLAMAEHDVEWSAQVILRQIANNGPMRASAIADYLHSDPSTVSRQVATMVKEGPARAPGRSRGRPRQHPRPHLEGRRRHRRARRAAAEPLRRNAVKLDRA